MCIEDGVLRARLDGELGPLQAREVEAHLAACTACRERAEAMAARAGRVGALLSDLNPAEALVDAGAALARFRARQETPAEPSLLERLFPKRWAPAWGALAAAALIALLAASGETRAFAQKLLGLFRVRNIVVVSIDRSAMSEGQGKLLGQMLSDNIVVTKKGERQPVADREQASQAAGFAVRLLTARTDTPRLTLQGEHAFHLTVDPQRVEAVLNIIGRPDLRFPDSLNGAKVAVDIPKSVIAAYGDCPSRAADVPPEKWYSCVMLGQFPAPTVITLPDLDIAPIAEVALQLAGMSQEEARSFSQTVDWTSTLVIPLPRDVASFEHVEVDGAKGVLVTHPPFRRRPASYALLWAKNGIIYSLSGFGNPAAAAPLADSLQ